MQRSLTKRTARLEALLRQPASPVAAPVAAPSLLLLIPVESMRLGVVPGDEGCSPSEFSQPPAPDATDDYVATRLPIRLAVVRFRASGDRI